MWDYVELIINENGFTIPQSSTHHHALEPAVNTAQCTIVNWTVSQQRDQEGFLPKTWFRIEDRHKMQEKLNGSGSISEEKQ